MSRCNNKPPDVIDNWRARGPTQSLTTKECSPFVHFVLDPLCEVFILENILEIIICFRIFFCECVSFQRKDEIEMNRFEYPV